MVFLFAHVAVNLALMADSRAASGQICGTCTCIYKALPWCFQSDSTGTTMLDTTGTRYLVILYLVTRCSMLKASSWTEDSHPISQEHGH